VLVLQMVGISSVRPCPECQTLALRTPTLLENLRSNRVWSVIAFSSLCLRPARLRMSRKAFGTFWTAVKTATNTKKTLTFTDLAD